MTNRFWFCVLLVAVGCARLVPRPTPRTHPSRFHARPTASPISPGSSIFSTRPTWPWARRIWFLHAGRKSRLSQSRCQGRSHLELLAPRRATNYAIAVSDAVRPTPTHRVILFEYMHTFRSIPLNGRPHPADMEPAFMGDSTGHWEGDTIVVDTVGLKGPPWTWLDTAGHSIATRCT
jgi:hypothetical protein